MFAACAMKDPDTVAVSVATERFAKRKHFSVTISSSFKRHASLHLIPHLRNASAGKAGPSPQGEGSPSNVAFVNDEFAFLLTDNH
jgi:hypothetical protein